MRFSILKEDLVSALRVAIPFTGKDAEILACVRLSVEHGKLRVASTGRNMECVTDTPVSDVATCVEPIYVNAETFNRIVNLFKPGAVISIYDDDGELVVASGPFRHSLFITPGAFSVRDAKSQDAQLNIPCADLLRSIKLVSHAMDPGSLDRPYLDGVHFRFDGDTLYFEATDGHRACKTSLEIEGTHSACLIIPSQFINALSRLLPNSNTQASVCYSDNHIAVGWSGHTWVSASLKDHKFPDYDRIVPKEFAQSIPFKKSDLVSAAKHSLATAGAKGSTMRFEIVSSKLEITSSETRGRSRVNMDLGYAYEDIIIGINANFLLDALSIIEGEDVNLCLTERAGPFAVKGQNIAPIIMPVRVN